MQGTFTILFTDLEGSTDLRVRVGDSTANEIINLHDDLVRSRLEIAGAVETKSLGDGFMALFTSANQAIQTGVAIQRDAHIRLALDDRTAQRRGTKACRGAVDERRRWR